VICTLGDLLLDVVVRLDGPIAEDTDTYGRTRVGPGGQAANVAAWVATLGGRARFVGKRAVDTAGRMLVDELERRGVEVVGPETESGTGTVVSIASVDGKRTMLTDRGVSPDLRAEELQPDWLAGCKRLHLPAYSLVVEPIRAAAVEAATLVPRLSVDLSSTTAIAGGVEEFRGLLSELRADIVFGNEAEVELLGEIPAETVVVKRGGRGVLVRRDGSESEWSAVPAKVVDTTGAGDALAAGFLLGGPELGLAAAARCVAQMGAFPPG
jgi:sugar/nucleoside kinase (ribokinase family)